VLDDAALDRMIALVRTVADAPRSPIGADTPLLSSGLVDSLSMNELATVLEDAYGVPLDVAEFGFDNADTPRQLLTLVESRS
jgi:acyl carrier protein